MKSLENLNMVGELEISLDYGKGKGREAIFKKKNLITKASKQFLLSGIYLPGIVSDQVTTLKVGTGGSVDPAGLYPKSEDPTQTGLITLLTSVPVVYTLDVASIAVTFLADMDQSMANGSLLTECGLFKASGAIFNIKNHPGIQKTSDFSVHYSWVIRYL